MPRLIQIYDTTLRDGEQTPFVVFSVEQKVTIARALADLGVDIIEVGFPAASESDQEAVRRVSTELTARPSRAWLAAEQAT